MSFKIKKEEICGIPSTSSSICVSKISLDISAKLFPSTAIHEKYIHDLTPLNHMRMLQVKTNLFKLHFKFKAYFSVHQLITLRQGRSRKTVLGADLWQIGQTAARNCRGKGNQLKRGKS
jgi:hypothetical protein